ncbi:MAG: hypothetical protein LBQ16_04610 [Gracilibacteraceae bacterium]|jgi:hypothetical protein|nr:hypothetical protein [Gracilibacteraceae bacterium]
MALRSVTAQAVAAAANRKEMTRPRPYLAKSLSRRASSVSAPSLAARNSSFLSASSATPFRVFRIVQYTTNPRFRQPPPLFEDARAGLKKIFLFFGGKAEGFLEFAQKFLPINSLIE